MLMLMQSFFLERVAEFFFTVINKILFLFQLTEEVEKIGKLLHLCYYIDLYVTYFLNFV